MKRIALSLLAVLALGAPAKAIVGGPWDNNLFYSPTLNGTFQGTMTAKNLSAVMVFSMGETNSDVEGTDVWFPNAGRMVSFYRGAIAISGIEAVPDANTRKIAAAIFAMESSYSLGINGFMTAKFDNIYPSITFKGKGDMLAYWDVDDEEYYEEFQSRVRGIKTSNQSSGNWIW